MTKKLLALLIILANITVNAQTLTFSSMRTFMSSEDTMGELNDESGTINIDTPNNKITIKFTTQSVVYRILSFNKEADITTYNCERAHPGTGNVYNFTMIYDPFYLSFKLIPLFDGVFSTYFVYNLNN